MKDLGPIPGRYELDKNLSLFKIFINPKLKLYLTKKGLNSSGDYSTIACGVSQNCLNIVQKGGEFAEKVKLIYPKRTQGKHLLEDRPDFYFGNLLKLFSSKLFQKYIDLTKSFAPEFDDPIQDAIWQMEVEMFYALLYVSFGDTQSPKCFSIIKNLLPNHYDDFIGIMKYSQTQSSFLN